MKTGQKAAYHIYIISGSALIIAGVIYLLCPTFLPYHRQIIGMDWEKISRGVQIFIQGSIKIAGGAFIVIGMTTLVLTLIPYRRGERWAKFVIPAILFLFGSVLMYVNTSVAVRTNAATPWPVTAAGLVLIIAAFILSIDYKRKD